MAKKDKSAAPVFTNKNADPVLKVIVAGGASPCVQVSNNWLVLDGQKKDRTITWEMVPAPDKGDWKLYSIAIDSDPENQISLIDITNTGAKATAQNACDKESVIIYTIICKDQITGELAFSDPIIENIPN